MKVTPKQYAALLYEATKEAKGAELTRQVKAFIQLLARNRALSLLPRIKRVYIDCYNTQEKIVDVTVVSAREISSHAVKQLKGALHNQNVECFAKVDPAVLGGAQIRAGDYMIDDTLKARLAQLKQTMYGR